MCTDNLIHCMYVCHLLGLGIGLALFRHADQLLLPDLSCGLFASFYLYVPLIWPSLSKHALLSGVAPLRGTIGQSYTVLLGMLLFPISLLQASWATVSQRTRVLS